jgi:hypothetical protein
MLPGSFTEPDIGAVEAALRPLPQVEKVLSGAEALPRLLRFRDWVNGALWAGFGLLCAMSFLVFVLQETARGSKFAADAEFLKERGVPEPSLAVSRAAAALLTGFLLSLFAAAVAAAALFLLAPRIPEISRVVGTPAELLAPSFLVPMALFPVAAALLTGAASLLGWRSARR